MILNPRATTIDYIYESLRSDIIKLKLKPGEKISEVQIATQYQVSRAPVRDAIRMLKQDKLVFVKPQIGTIVAPVSLEKARDICQVRLLLEPFAAEIAVAQITDDDLRLLTEQFEKLANIRGQTEARKQCIFETDNILHRTIWRLCGNMEIYQIIDGYKDEIHRIRLATLKLANRTLPTKEEMRSIYEALQRRDPIAAREAMFTHILNLKTTVEEVLTEEN
jgi:DNA-binding GntR family transcriptional regulator